MQRCQVGPQVQEGIKKTFISTTPTPFSHFFFANFIDKAT